MIQAQLPPPTVIQHILFDNDGTLIDTESVFLKLMLRNLSEAGIHIAVEEYAQLYVGLRDEDILNLLNERHGTRLDRSFYESLYHEMRTLFDQEVEAVSGMPDLVRDLTCGASIVSNGSTKHILRCARRIGIDGCFNHRFFGVELVQRPKPAPDLYLLALETLGLKPYETVVVEDSPTGVRAGKAAGIFTIGFLGAAHDREQHGRHLLSAGADILADDATALRNIFATLQIIEPDRSLVNSNTAQ
jgi:HAD superfamily hydrolase (TIGR01509 family)